MTQKTATKKYSRSSISLQEGDISTAPDSEIGEASPAIYVLFYILKGTGNSELSFLISDYFCSFFIEHKTIFVENSM